MLGKSEALDHPARRHRTGCSFASGTGGWQTCTCSPPRAQTMKDRGQPAPAARTTAADQAAQSYGRRNDRAPCRVHQARRLAAPSTSDSAFGKNFHTPPGDDALPIISAIATLPIVMRDGNMLAGRGLDRERGIVFRIPSALLAMLPRPADCTPGKVAEAIRFLCDEWLCDVAADYAGKCILLGAAMDGDQGGPYCPGPARVLRHRRPDAGVVGPQPSSCS